MGLALPLLLQFVTEYKKVPMSLAISTEYGVLTKHLQDRNKLLFVKDTTSDPTNRGDRILVPQSRNIG